MVYIETPRLLLRNWRETDLSPFARINGNHRVMEYFPAPLSYAETETLFRHIQTEFDEYGYGPYAVEEKQTGNFIGCVGFHHVSPPLEFAPAVEILWRLDYPYWKSGYATEAATACLVEANERLNLPEVYAFTSITNQRSERVMQKIGMTRMGEFDHPLVDPSHRLCRHVLYKTVF